MNLYDVSVPVFVKGLENLKMVLRKGEAHAAAKSLDPTALLGAKLAPDMFDFTRQVQIATDNAKGISARLAGMEPPKMEDKEKTFGELSERVDTTIAFLKTLSRDQFEGGAERHIAFPYEKGKYLLGDRYLFEMSIPNFFFHMVTAYDILRNQGVELSKSDFIGTITLKDM